MAYNAQKTITWNRETPNDGLLLDAEFNRIYENFRTLIPVGTIIAWLPGYFANASNGSFAQVTIDLSDIWKECDGSALNDAGSPIFNAAGRYLPNLTDNRFLMGGTSGAIGGSNDLLAHTHAFTQPSNHSNHVFTQPSNHSNHVFTQPSAHGITQPNFTAPNHVHSFYVFSGSSSSGVYDGNGTFRQLNLAYPHSGAGYYIPINASSSGNYDLGDAFTSSNGGTICTRTADVALTNNHSGGGVDAHSAHSGGGVDAHSAHSGGAVNAVNESRVNANLPLYLAVKYIMRIK